MSALSARDGYSLWAAHYHQETATSALEEQLVRELPIPLRGRALLDAGCGIGRRLDPLAEPACVGVDLTPAMLAHAEPGLRLAAANVCALPFGRSSFDVVWCRLVIGHVRDLSSAYGELARVCRRGGDVVVTDFHPAAVAAGHRRTFRDATGVLREVEHHVHQIQDHARAAAEAGLEERDRRAGTIGESVRRYYVDAQRLSAYEAQRGLPLVLALSYRRAE
jgi:malonyl-CoA O-methyltransferase